MQKKIQAQRNKLIKYLENFLTKETKNFRQIAWSKDIEEKLKEFTLSGKLLRGVLVLLAARRSDDTALRVAAAVELVHSAILVQDDIMDQDLLRRGLPSMHAQYQAQSPNEKEAKHYGISQAISLSDVGIFLAFILLGGIKNSNKKTIIDFFARNMIYTGFGQMQDMYCSVSKEEPTTDDITMIYKLKTAYYSISNPIALGLYIQGASAQEIKKAREIGESLGIAFQMKDDELGVWGDTRETGKANFHDVRENKKTLLRLFFFAKTETAEKNKLLKIFGKKQLSKADEKYVLNLLAKYQIKETHTMMMQKLMDTAQASFKKVSPSTREIFEFIMSYNATRNK